MEEKPYEKDDNKVIHVPDNLPKVYTPSSKILATMLPLKGSLGMQEGHMSIRKSVSSMQKNSFVQDVIKNIL